MRFHLVQSVLVGFAMLIAGECARAAEPALARHAHLRRPVAAGLLNGGRTLALANQRGSSLSLIDLGSGKVVTETRIGSQLSGLAVTPDGRHVLVTDEKQHELLVLAYDAGSVRLIARSPVAAYPASIAVSPDGQWATVAGRWSRRLDTIDLSGLATQSAKPMIKVTKSVTLPFAPREQFMLAGSARVVVADAFGGGLALVDVQRGEIVASHELSAHNIRGLAVSSEGKDLLLTHQTLEQKRPITQLAVERGEVIRNVVRRIPLARLQDAKTLGRNETTAFRLDDDWIHGAADPAGITLAGKYPVISLSGNNMLAVLDEAFQVERRLNVGARPTVVLREPLRGDLVVVNTLSDSVSVLDLSGERLPREIPLGPLPKLTSRERGETLFYDAVLSPHGWFSCHSCHSDGHTNGRLADTSGDGSFGAPKRTLTLLGSSLTDRWAWSGEVPDLHAQVGKSLATTMHGAWATPENVLDLVDYLHTLPPPPPLEPARSDAADAEQLARGRTLFAERGCVKCHVPPLTFTSQEAYDVGLADELGRKKFNPPSLRGVSQGSRFFHDNRANSLEAVFTEHGHGLDADLSPSELADLLRYLRSL